MLQNVKHHALHGGEMGWSMTGLGSGQIHQQSALRRHRAPFHVAPKGDTVKGSAAKTPVALIRKGSLVARVVPRDSVQLDHVPVPARICG